MESPVSGFFKVKRTNGCAGVLKTISNDDSLKTAGFFEKSY